MDVPASGGKEPMRIKVLDGPAQGKMFLLEKREVTIGPGEDMDIYLPFEGIKNTMSAGRARITVKDNECWLEELGSTGGIFVNGCKIDKEVRLKAGNTFRLGQITFQIMGPCVERDVLLREEVIKTIIT
jgi:pSer/pThr/pTyr-binding forkhead associated (FHA) protein